MIAKEELISIEKEAKDDQKVASELNAQQEVLNKGFEFWKQVNEFSIQKKILSPEFTKAMKYALQIPNAIPSGYQSKKLLDLLRRAESEGFKFVEDATKYIAAGRSGY